MEKERAMHDRFEKRIEDAAWRRSQRWRANAGDVEGRVGQLLVRNTRAAGSLEARVADRGDGYVVLTWTKREGSVRG